LAGTPNDGSQAVTIPNVSTTTGRIMVKGSNHIFFDVNNANISVNAGSGTSDTLLLQHLPLRLQELLLQAPIFHGQALQIM
jgi:hypothetical protein